MINLYTVATAPMFPYAKIFFGSLYSNINLSNINKVFVLDAGLSAQQAAWLGEKYNKIEFVAESGEQGRTEQRLVARKHKDVAWGKTVSLKTKTLSGLFTMDSTYPYVMLDLDSYFIQDFYDDIFRDLDFDVGLCRRLRPMGIGGTGPNGCAYIGSFFVANNRVPKKTRKFMKLWMQIMSRGGRLKETPSLCRLISGYRLGWQGVPNFKPKPVKGYKVREFEEEIFSCYKAFSENTKIVHFKSFGGRGAFSNPKAYLKRFGRIKGFFGRDKVKEFLEEGYLESHCANPDFLEV